MTPELSEDQPINDDDPVVGNDVAEDFEAMVAGTPPEDEPIEEQDEAVEESVDESEDSDEPEQTEQPEEADEPEPDEQESLEAELKRYRDEEVARLRAQVAAYESNKRSGAAQTDRPAPNTVGALFSPYEPDPRQFADYFQDQWFIGIAEGETPASAYQAIMGVPPENDHQVHALNGFANRIYRATMRNVLRAFPALFDGNLQSVVSRAQMDEAFWTVNKDLDDARPIVVALSQQLSAAEPHLTPQEFNAKLASMVRKQLKRDRPVTKSGGTKRREPQQKGRKPALAGGTGARKAPGKRTAFDDEFDALRKATIG